MMTTQYGPVSPELLEQFCADQAARYAERGTIHSATFYAMSGPKYARIVCQEGPDDRVASRSVACFIELATGSILKADGWKKPARGIRGNVHAADRGASAMTPYSARYAR